MNTVINGIHNLKESQRKHIESEYFTHSQLGSHLLTFFFINIGESCK